MSDEPSNNPLAPWRPGTEVPEDETALWQEALVVAGGESERAAADIENEARKIDAVAEPYRAVLLWSILVRRRLAVGEETTPETLDMIRELADARRHAGIRRRDLLPPLYAWLRERWLEIEGPEGAHAIVALVDLGWALGLSGDLDGSRGLLEEGERRSLEAFGEQGWHYVEACRRLAHVMDLSSKEKEAIVYAKRAWDLAKQAFGELDRLTLQCAATCATVHVSLGQREEALEIGKWVFEEKQKKLGKRHTATLSEMSVHAGRLGIDGHVHQADTMAKEAYDLIREVLGPAHPKTVSALRQYAAARSRIGDYSTAKSLREQVLDGHLEIYGNFHPKVLIARNDFAYSLRQIGNVQKALEMYREVYQQKTEHISGTRSWRISMHNLGFTLMDVEKFEEARNLLDRCFQERTKVHGPKHRATMTSSMVLGLCHARSGRPEEGLALLQKALEWRKENHGTEKTATAMAFRNLGECYFALRKYADAVAAFEQARKIRVARLGQRHPTTLWSSVNLIEALLEIGEMEAARSLLLETLTEIQDAIAGGLVWLKATTACLELAVRLISAGQEVSWVEPARVLSAKYLEAVDLSDPDEGAYLQEYFWKFHSAWLSLCLTSPEGAAEIPSVLSAIQGREMAAMVLADIEAREADFPEGDPRQRYLETVRQLRRLRVMLRALGDGSEGEEEPPKGGGGTRSVDRNAEAIMRAAQERAQLHAETSARYAKLMADYETLRAELARTDETFARAYTTSDMGMTSLTQLLEPGSALVMLFSRQGEDGSTTHHACCLTAEGDAATLALPEVPAVLADVKSQNSRPRATAGRAVLRGGHGLFSMAAEAQAVPETTVLAEEPENAAPENLDALMRRAFWDPLTSRFPDIRRWHVATHQGLHLLPIHVGADTDHVCLSYPGVLFFWLLHTTEAPAARAPTPHILLHTDRAEETDKPIPFVEAEASLIRAIWGEERVHIADGAGTLQRLQADDPLAEVLVLAAHGDELTGPPRQTVIYLDAVRRLQLEANSILSAVQRPSTVLVSACVAGRVVEDDGGEPLGLVTAFFLNGGRFVLAPLQPISDFYAPIFMGLFHHAWRETGNPVEAMQETRRRAQSGHWPGGFTTLVRGAYAPIMERILAQAWERRADADHLKTVVAPIVGDWPLPEPYRSQWELGVMRRVLETACSTPEKRTELVSGTLDALVAQRRSIPAMSDIRNCTVAFGA